MQRLLLFLLFVFLIAAVLRVDFYFTIAYLFFGVYLLARLWVRRGLKDVRVERRFIDRAFHGDRLPVRLSISNTGRLPVTWLHARESIPVSLRQTTPRHQVFSLDPGERRDIDYALYCSKRGVFSIGPTRIQTGDALGLIKPENVEAPPDRLIVYPKVVPLQRLGLPTRSPLATLPAPLPLFEDPARVGELQSIPARLVAADLDLDAGDSARARGECKRVVASRRDDDRTRTHPPDEFRARVGRERFGDERDRRRGRHRREEHRRERAIERRGDDDVAPRDSPLGEPLPDLRDVRSERPVTGRSASGREQEGRAGIARRMLEQSCLDVVGHGWRRSRARRPDRAPG